MGPSRSFCNGTTSALQPEEILRSGLEFPMCTINKSANKKKSGILFNDPCSFVIMEIQSLENVSKYNRNNLEAFTEIRENLKQI